MAARQRSRPVAPSALTSVQWAGLGLAVVALVVPWLLDVPDLSPAGERMLGVFLLAVVLWVTEAIPLHATAVTIIMLEIAFISDQAFVATPEGFEAPAFAEFLAILAHPVLILFLGGFFLADGAAKFQLDRSLARVLLRPFGSSPKAILLGMMAITAVLSMFMSNTATTATMIAVMVPVLGSLDPDDRLRAGLALSIPFAANVGGIGTPVGTPPNAIALAALVRIDERLTFLDWMVLAVPFVIVILLLTWFVLLRLFPSGTDEMNVQIDADFDRSRPAIVFYVTAAATVGLWLTEPLHGIPSTIVGFVPVVVLLATRVFSGDDLKNVQWAVLWLVAGGIALGEGVSVTGLDEWLIGLVSWEAIPATLLVITLGVVALVMSTVISNSATANLLIPLGITMATSDAVAINPLLAGLIIAISCSLAMALPISTPPNAVAYSTGVVDTRDMMVAGSVVGAVGLAVFVLVAPPLWRSLGLVP